MPNSKYALNAIKMKLKNINIINLKVIILLNATHLPDNLYLYFKC